MAEDRQDETFRGLGDTEREKTVAEPPVSEKDIERIRKDRENLEEDLADLESEADRTL